MDPLPLLSPYSCPLIQSSASVLHHFFFCLKRDDGLKELGHQFYRSGVKINLYSYLTIKHKPTEWHPSPGGHRDGMVRQGRLWSPRATWGQLTPSRRVCVSVDYKSLLLASS